MLTLYSHVRRIKTKVKQLVSNWYDRCSMKNGRHTFWGGVMLGYQVVWEGLIRNILPSCLGLESCLSTSPHPQTPPHSLSSLHTEFSHASYRVIYFV